MPEELASFYEAVAQATAHPDRTAHIDFDDGEALDAWIYDHRLGVGTRVVTAEDVASIDWQALVAEKRENLAYELAQLTKMEAVE